MTKVSRNLVENDVSTPFLKVSSYDSLSAAISAIGNSVVDLVVDRVETLAADVTIPSNVDLRFVRGGMISGAYTLTINGGIEAGLFQIFSSDLTIAGALTVAKPEWWGAIVNGLVDCTSAIQSALNVAKTVLLSSGTYKRSSSISFTLSGQALVGVGEISTIISGTDNTAIYAGSLDSLHIKDVKIDNNQTDFSSTNAAYGILLESCTDCVIERVRIENTRATGIQVSYGSGNVVRFCATRNNAVSGIDHKLSPGSSVLFCRSLNDGKGESGEFSSISINSADSLTLGNFCDGNTSGGQGINLGHPGRDAENNIAVANIVKNITGKGFRLCSLPDSLVALNLVDSTTESAFKSYPQTTDDGTAYGLKDAVFALNRAKYFGDYMLESSEISGLIVLGNIAQCGGTAKGLYLLRNTEGVVLGNRVADSSLEGIEATETENSVVSGNLVTGSAQNGVDVHLSDGVACVGNVAEGNTLNGVFISTMKGAAIGNIAKNNISSDFYGGLNDSIRRGLNYSPTQSVSSSDYIMVGACAIRFDSVAMKMQYSTDNGVTWIDI